MTRYYWLVLLFIFSLGTVYAQDVSVTTAPPPEIVICPSADQRCPAAAAMPPMPPPPIPDTKRGFFDMAAKAAPGIIAGLMPIGMIILQMSAPGWFMKIPKGYRPIVSGLLATLAAATTATGTDAALGGAGGVSPGTAALEAGPVAGVFHVLLNKVVTAVQAAEVEPPKEG